MNEGLIEKASGQQRRKAAEEVMEAEQGVVSLAGDGCADSPECMSWLENAFSQQMQHLCGSPLSPKCSGSNLLKYSLKQLATPDDDGNKGPFARGSFAVLGLTEHMFETLELLE